MVFFIYHPGQTKFGDVTFNIFYYDIAVYAFAVVVVVFLTFKQ